MIRSTTGVFLLVVAMAMLGCGRTPVSPSVEAGQARSPVPDKIKPGATTRAAGPLLINVLANGTYVVNGQTAENVEALERLLGTLKVDRNVPATLNADGSVLWEHVVAAFEAAIRAGFTRVGFAGQNASDGST